MRCWMLAGFQNLGFLSSIANAPLMAARQLTSRHAARGHLTVRHHRSTQMFGNSNWDHQQPYRFRTRAAAKIVLHLETPATNRRPPRMIRRIVLRSASHRNTPINTKHSKLKSQRAKQQPSYQHADFVCAFVQNIFHVNRSTEYAPLSPQTAVLEHIARKNSLSLPEKCMR